MALVIALAVSLVLLLHSGYCRAAQDPSADCSKEGLPRELVPYFINQHFRNLVGPQSNNVLAGYAALELKESQALF